MARSKGRACAVLVAAAVLNFIIGETLYCAEPVSPAIEKEALVLLSRYIQINTSNPPGNEIKAARFFKTIFDREGIEVKIIESAPGRANVYARLRGSGSKKALVLLNHMDVVPAQAGRWKEPPFSGANRDGYIWGRGALDMKGPAILELMSMILAKRRNLPLRGDLIFLGTADEEAGGGLGAGFLLAKHAELIKDAGLVINEGGGIRVGRDGRARYYSVGVAEKTPLWLRLTASGKPGHGSTPGTQLAVNKLVLALDRLIQYRSPVKVLPEVQKFYADTAPLEAPERQKQLADLRTALTDPFFAAEFLKEARNNARVRNTLSITVLKGSDKVNVIPAEASADVDARLLPGEDPQAFIAEIRRVMDEDSIQIKILLSFPPATSPPNVEASKAIAELAKAYDGDVPVVTPLVSGFTDCHFFREKGIPCYGFIPLRRSLEGESLEHGVNERISIDNFASGVRVMFDLVRRLVIH